MSNYFKQKKDGYQTDYVFPPRIGFVCTDPGSLNQSILATINEV
jgi:hypothetical protein